MTETVKHKPKNAAAGASAKLPRKKYEAELAILQAELVALQEWVKATGAKICVVFEGRDTAGKGGTIKRIVERVSPRVFRVVALPAPNEREKSQMYLQRYLPHLPSAGEVIIFDRSWYNRAGVERVMGFCTPEQVTRFLETAPAVEKAMVDSGIILIKYWLEVSPDEQTRRLERRIDDPRKIWKLSDMDLKSYNRWFDYSRARDDMFAATDTDWAPWWIAHTDNKRRGRLNIISHLLSQIPYEPLPDSDVTLPERQAGGRLPGAGRSHCATSQPRSDTSDRQLATREALADLGSRPMWFPRRMVDNRCPSPMAAAAQQQAARDGGPMSGHQATKQPTFCPLCVSRCGATAVITDGVFVALQPDPSHPTGQALCVKGKAAPELVYHPERLLHPLKRTNPKGADDPGWERITWDEALDTVAARLTAFAREHGPESVVFGSASPSTSAMSDSVDWLIRLRRAFGSPNLVASMELCGWGRYLASIYTFGDSVPGVYLPDLDDAGCILFWGYNPSVARLAHATSTTAALASRGAAGRRRPATAGLATKADHWLRVRPGTDAALALSLTHVMIEHGWYDEDFVRRWTNAPLLVRTDTSRLLRASDLSAEADPGHYVGWDEADARPVGYHPAQAGTTWTRSVSRCSANARSPPRAARWSAGRCSTSSPSSAVRCGPPSPRRSPRCRPWTSSTPRACCGNRGHSRSTPGAAWSSTAAPPRSSGRSTSSTP